MFESYSLPSHHRQLKRLHPLRRGSCTCGDCDHGAVLGTVCIVLQRTHTLHWRLFTDQLSFQTYPTDCVTIAYANQYEKRELGTNQSVSCHASTLFTQSAKV